MEKTDMETVGAEAARKRLPELLERALLGKQTLISRHGQSVAALVPLNQRMLPQRQILLGLRGSGRHCWQAENGHRAWRPVHLSQLPHGAMVAIDSSALIAFLSQTGGAGAGYDPLLQAIALGRCRGLISTLSLGRLLIGPLRQGNEALAQRYAAVFSDPAGWQQVAPCAAIVQAAARLQLSQDLPETAALDLSTALHGGAIAIATHNPQLAQTAELPVLTALR
ncbi:MAG: type II toxin-antitoxin system Phd/YefM family antitoxin [Synechococcus lacustris]|jgi:antitoxin (DNA-binding transcriptional repressor) of toxin-antitoxin stability system/predicted nucleic acid-binding protein